MVGKSHDVGTDGTTEQSSYLTIVCVCVLTGEVLVTADFFPSSGHYHCVLHQRVSHHPHQGRVCVCLYVCMSVYVVCGGRVHVYVYIWLYVSGGVHFLCILGGGVWVLCLYRCVYWRWGCMYMCAHGCEWRCMCSVCVLSLIHI